MLLAPATTYFIKVDSLANNEPNSIYEFRYFGTNKRRPILVEAKQSVNN